MLELCETRVVFRRRYQFLSQNRQRGRSGRRIDAKLRIQTPVDSRSLQSANRRGARLRKQKSRARRDTNQGWFRQRLPQQISLLVSAARSLRKIRQLIVDLRASVARSDSAASVCASAMEFAFPAAAGRTALELMTPAKAGDYYARIKTNCYRCFRRRDRFNAAL